MKQFTGKQYLAIDIANSMGLDKLTWDDRIRWVQDHDSELEALTEAADAIPQYRKAVYAWRHLDQASGHMMFLDATASGLQIMAVLSGDIETAEAVNLVDPNERKDVYQTVADSMSELLNYTVSKALIKKPVMTHFYNKSSHEDVLTSEQQAAFYEVLNGKFQGPQDIMMVLNKRWNSQAYAHKFTMPDGHVCHIPVTEMFDKEF